MVLKLETAQVAPGRIAKILSLHGFASDRYIPLICRLPKDNKLCYGRERFGLGVSDVDWVEGLHGHSPLP